MEDLFNVAKASPGLDGQGHIGFAAQPGLKAFGADVFNNCPEHVCTGSSLDDHAVTRRR
jgi:hypothetical protein